jgi:hypothetical protein
MCERSSRQCPLSIAAPVPTETSTSKVISIDAFKKAPQETEETELSAKSSVNVRKGEMMRINKQLNARQMHFVEGVALKNLTNRAAALEAGYSPRSASCIGS